MDSVGSGPQQDNVIIPLYIVSVIMLIASLIMSVVVSARIMKVKLATIISMIFLYGIANGISFGILFYAIQVTPDTNVHMVDFLVCFLITCGVFAITGFLGTLLSLRFTLSLGKFIMIATFSFMFIFLILIIVSLFTNILGGDKIQLVIYGIWGGLMILYVLYDFSMIKKSQSFTDLLDSDTQTKFVFMFGFTMLVNLIQLF
jgi:FtsH-binding integral membrane protein